jgi:tetratricopeptide (TPR) repeat protein
MVRANVDERRSTQHSAQSVSSATLQTGEASSSFLRQEDTKQALQGESDASCVMDAEKGHALRGDQEHENLQQQEALLLQQAQHGTSIQKKENAIQLLLVRQQMLRPKQNESLENQAYMTLLSGEICELQGRYPEAKQYYREAFTLYQEERADYEYMGARHEREIIIKMMFCLRLLQRRCQKENDVQKVLKLSEIIESLEKQSDALLSPSVATEREVAQDNALSYDSASALMTIYAN